MKKFFKTVMVIGGTALAAHYGLRAYKYVNGVVKLSKSLPEFLNNVYGEKPKLSINRAFKTMSIKAGFTQEVLDKHTDIETTIREYIDDFYPELGKGTVTIDVYAKTPEESAEPAAEDSEEG
ncbi:MAG TPA: hypothetical protein PLG20_05570 [Candidatus Syntrophosphaera sp.]|mgnify:CR=1 FL=1|jgi:hypothetical protein|nr:hypothetical protein [Candidatus Syntrophosphaera sp.]